MIYHVLPINDIEPHVEESTCRCKPNILFENGHMIIVHNSFDGREYKEQLFKKIEKN
jgi:hypothetical protein